MGREREWKDGSQEGWRSKRENLRNSRNDKEHLVAGRRLRLAGRLLQETGDSGLLWLENGHWRQPIGRTFEGKRQNGTVHLQLSASLGQPGVRA